MLAVYTYYCIVQRGGKGWKIWMMRRDASNKVESLPLATEDDVAAKADLCPICYQVGFTIKHCWKLLGHNTAKWSHIGSVFAHISLICSGVFIVNAFRKPDARSFLQSMEGNVRIMHCSHMFHGTCLKKWFYIQDKCPMCYAEFKGSAKSDADASAGDAPPEAGASEQQLPGDASLPPTSSSTSDHWKQLMFIAIAVKSSFSKCNSVSSANAMQKK